ncbi:SDR family oxidoreductase [Aquirhabdus sp.]|uniref:SDR family oxidoreductase n=1 Tax=Aquirhabdus sp. TaxID=2824160 RepID=UPI00396C5BAC
MSTILVTGGSGFIANHILIRLLSQGHQVRTTVRNINRAADVRAMIHEGGIDPNEGLFFFVADLEQDQGWTEAVAGCDYVLHVASPFPAQAPQNEDDLIIPAREGTLRVLRAARDAGVKRVVLTSSFAAIGYGHPEQSLPFDETTWTNLDSPHVTAYAKSKTIAERAAWDFIAQEGGNLELSVINPVAVFGPVLSADYSSSITLIYNMLTGKLPSCPKLYFGSVDVRDVVDLHLHAMTHPAAKGERFIAVAGNFLTIREVARMLKLGLGHAADKVPSSESPNWLVRLTALFNPTVKQILPELGKFKNATSLKAQERLGWQPRSSEVAIIASAQSLIQLGLLKKTKPN